MKMSLFAGKMERELFNYMKFDGGTMPFNEDVEFEASLVENYVYIIPQVCTYNAPNLVSPFLKCQDSI